MNAVLIPFFLGTQAAVNDSWPYGPEYIFQVQVNGSAFPWWCAEPKVKVRMCTRLVCQPKAHDTLSCHLNGTRTELSLREAQAPEIPMEQVYYMEEYTVNEGQFELMFTDDGLDGIRADRNIHKRELDIVRSIVGGLNFGMNFRAQRENVSRAIETFAGGRCEANLTIDRKPISQLSLAGDGEFRILPRFATIESEVLEIVKIRDLKKCVDKFPYYFGSCAACHLNDDAVVDLEISENRMIISSTEFISCTANLIRMTSSSEPTRWNRLCEDVNLRLEKVQPATSHPPEVEAPMMTDIFTTKWFIRNDDSEENSNNI